jgi:hypothetical protein
MTASSTAVSAAIPREAAEKYREDYPNTEIAPDRLRRLRALKGALMKTSAAIGPRRRPWSRR